MLIRTGKAHPELIWCPECKEQQVGYILEAYPFPIYIHTCVKCKYVITESEWNPVVKVVRGEVCCGNNTSTSK